MPQWVVQAPAKINLFLQIHGKRPDGYHELSTVMHTLELCDTLTFAASPQGLKITCDHPQVPVDERNLVWRAAMALAEKCGHPPDVHIHIRKRIPVAAGMGGGSSDAAATLQGLARGWRIERPRLLLAIAKTLGSDVAFFLTRGCALGTGRGEKIVPWPPLAGIHVVVINPGFPVSTAEVYKKFRLGLTSKKPYINMMRQAIVGKNPGKIGENLYNDLESVTLKLFPQIAQIKEDLLACGAEAAMMTGSGPTVFGLLSSARMARQASRRLGAKYQTVLVTRTSGQ